jgi:phospholipid/cholesterol/gamma-HCH transport system permease protein
MTSFVAFFEQAFSKIDFLDIATSVVKAIAYGFTIGIVGCYKGYHATSEQKEWEEPPILR